VQEVLAREFESDGLLGPLQRLSEGAAPAVGVQTNTADPEAGGLNLHFRDSNQATA